MNRNLRLKIEYDGTDYCGWQKQGHQGKISIQEIIEQALQKILQEKIKLVASGRTDAGVHALAQTANFKTKSVISLERLRYALNGNLSEGIAIAGIKEVSHDFHSRFSAKGKIYCYTILNSACRRPLSGRYNYYCPYPLDARLMKKEASALLGRHNFSAFCASAGKEKKQERLIKKLLVVKERGLIKITIEADGFLYNMVRNIAGTLIEIGRGRFPAGSMKKILLSRDRKLAGPTAAARGLCLLAVKY